MSDHAKFERLLRILMLLTKSSGYTLEELAEKTNLSERSIYRYLETIEQTGFILNRHNGFFSIEKNRGLNKDLHDLLHFSEEEAEVLNKAIHSINNNNLLKNNLLEKLYSLSDFDRVVETIIQKEYSENISNIVKAIKEHKQVRFINYESGNGNSITDRCVEPFRFTVNYLTVWCYEISSGMNKLFKTERIGRVEITDKNWEHTHEHKAGFVDIFRISTGSQIPLRLKLSLRAANLLKEEYPAATEMIRATDGCCSIFDGWLCDYQGISRFALGLMDELEILEPQSLKDHLNTKLRNKIF